MRFWLAKNSEVPLREQLLTQIKLGILSQDLAPGQKLPSTRELAHRYQIHANTVSAAYRELVERGWLEFRKGSGVYVRPLEVKPTLETELELDSLIAQFLTLARQKGFSLGEVQARVQHWLRLQPPDHFLLLEPDIELRRILVAELAAAVDFPVAGASPTDCQTDGLLAGAAVLAMSNRAEEVRAALPPGTACLLLHSRSITQALHNENKVTADALLTVVSRWPEFLQWGRAILTAAGIDPLALDLRDARVRGWQKSLAASTMVITDALTARELPAGVKARVFHLIADASLDELCRFKEFLTKPLA